MANIDTLKTDLSAIGDAIREKLSSEDTYKIDEMPAAIREISGGGGEDRLEDFLSNNISGEITVNVETLKSYAFFENKSLTKINLPNVKKIGGNICNSLSTLEEINMPNLEEITGANNFYYCSKLKNPFGINNKIKKITGAGNFQYCDKITSLELPKATNIYDSLAQYSKIKTLGLPAVINSGSGSGYWNYKTFYNNTNIRCLGIRDCTSLPSTSTSYSLCPYLSATNWTKFIIDNETPPTLASITGTFYSQANADRLTVYVPKNAVSAYEEATNWSSMNIAAIEDNESELYGIFNWIDEKYFSSEMTLLERWNKFLISYNFAYLGWSNLKLISDDLKANGEQSEFYTGLTNIVGNSFIWNDHIYTFIDTFKDIDENDNLIPFTISITYNKWFGGSTNMGIDNDSIAAMNPGYNNTKGGWEFTTMRKSLNGDSTQISTWSLIETTDEMISSITPHKKKYIYNPNSGVGGSIEERACIDIMSLFSSRQIYGDNTVTWEPELQTDSQYKLFADKGITISNYSDLKMNYSHWLSDISAYSPGANFCSAYYYGNAAGFSASTTLGRFLYITV